MAPDGQFSDWASAQVWRANTVYGWDYKYRINCNNRNVVYKCTAHLECFAQLNLHLVNEDSCVYIRYRGTHSTSTVAGAGTADRCFWTTGRSGNRMVKAKVWRWHRGTFNIV